MPTAHVGAATAPFAVEAFVVRAFTTDATDLSVAIDPARPVESTNALLTNCLRDTSGRSPSADALERWTVARRLDGLVRIREASGPRTETIALRCPEAGCREAFEVEIDLAACRRDGADLASSVAFAVEGRTLQARLPTGVDQARWQRDKTPLRLVAAILLGDPSTAPDDAVVSALEGALAAADPARRLELDLACPTCSTVHHHAIELEPSLLRAFATMQRAWMREILRLAWAFHWGEREIAAMPAWRRAFYLRQLDDDTFGGAQ